jgi:hypothetical protein
MVDAAAAQYPSFHQVKSSPAVAAAAAKSSQAVAAAAAAATHRVLVLLFQVSCCEHGPPLRCCRPHHCTLTCSPAGSTGSSYKVSSASNQACNTAASRTIARQSAVPFPHYSNNFWRAQCTSQKWVGSYVDFEVYRMTRACSSARFFTMTARRTTMFICKGTDHPDPHPSRGTLTEPRSVVRFQGKIHGS